MRPVEILMEEHELVLRMLDVMRSVSAKLRTGVDVPDSDLLKILEFIRGFADGCHHSKEEKVFFPALESAGIQKEGGPIGVMLKEHETGRKMAMIMSDSFSSSGQSGGLRLRFADAAEKYADLLEHHIEKENGVLFVMAGKIFSLEQQRKITDDFIKIEIEEAGIGVHEKYHGILLDLMHSYL
ncbi:MAG: hemerythrin domain-containing protein [Spirochaetes bacterium]|jgi:hemerythrin-like domain-containing protein|nr:hemerythrin domain-containing protein [Spirochaetota bacterium]